MEISQRNWTYWGRISTIRANDERIACSTKSILDDFEYKYEYKDLIPTPIRGRVGIRAYSPIGWWVLATGMIVSAMYNLTLMLELFIFSDNIHLLLMNFTFISLLLSILLFATRLIKVEMVWFLTKSESTAFSFILNKKNKQEVKEMVSYIEKKALETQEN